MRDPCRLYLITPPTIPDPYRWLPEWEQVLDAGDIACVQIRLKDVDDETIARTVAVLRPPAQRRGIAVLLNDRPDLAFETGCDGVHIGQEDGTVAAARQALGPDRIVGVTCHNSRHLAMEAGEEGADYVAFGAFFPTATKEVLHHADLDILQWWHDLCVVPSVAIGGITVDNAAAVIAAGVDFIAVSGGVWNHPRGPVCAVEEFRKLCEFHAGQEVRRD